MEAIKRNESQRIKQVLHVTTFVLPKGAQLAEQPLQAAERPARSGPDPDQEAHQHAQSEARKVANQTRLEKGGPLYFLIIIYFTKLFCTQIIFRINKWMSRFHKFTRRGLATTGSFLEGG